MLCFFLVENLRYFALLICKLVCRWFYHSPEYPRSITRCSWHRLLRPILLRTFLEQDRPVFRTIILPLLFLLLPSSSSWHLFLEPFLSGFWPVASIQNLYVPHGTRRRRTYQFPLYIFPLGWLAGDMWVRTLHLFSRLPTCFSKSY